MIDLSEELIPLRDVPKLKQMPARRGGKRLHCSTPYRWAGPGCRGIVLETVQVGGTRCTSLAALASFFAALSAVGPPARSNTRTPTQRQRSIAQAERELDDAGI